MNKIVMVGVPESWAHFARPILEKMARLFSFQDEQELLSSALAQQVTSDDLMVLSPTEGRPPSSELAALFRRLGPVRVLVVDGRFDYARLGDAMRGCAVGYEERPWDREQLIQLIDTYGNQEPPDQYAIDRRFGSWRVAV
jgi:hypothetical protein